MNTTLIMSTLLLITLGVSASFAAEGTAQWVGSLGLGMVCILGPIFWYYARLRRKHEKEGGLSDNDIDSVYYYGFLITLGTLAVTIVAVGIVTGVDPGSLSTHLTKIVPQFGFGLLATGLALLARLRLLAKEDSRTRQDVYQATERLALKVEALGGRFDRLGQTLGGLAVNTKTRGDSLLAAFEAVEAAFNERVKRMEDELDAAVRRSQAQAKQMELAFSQAASLFDAHLAQAAKESLDKTALAVDHSGQQFSRSVAQLSGEVGRLRQELDTLDFDAAARRLETFVQAMEASLGSVQSAVDGASWNAAAAIRQLADSARETHALAEKIANNLESLVVVGKLVGQIEQAGQGLEAIARGAGQSGDSLRELGRGAQEAATASAELGRRLDGAAASLDQAAQAGESLAKLTDAARQTHGLALEIAASLEQKPWYRKTVGEAFRAVFGKKR